MKILLFSLYSGLLWANTIAVSSAQVAAAVYDENPKTSFKLTEQHKNWVFGNRLLAFYDPPTDTVYIGVRGTTQIQNWLSNAHIGGGILSRVIPETLQKITKSWFVLAYEDLEEASEQIIKKHPRSKIIFVGHSYGGIMANLLAQSAYAQNPNLDFECHTFNAPGAREIRENSLKFRKLPNRILRERFFNHVRQTDLIGVVNTHEGNILVYESARHILDEHAMDEFAEDLSDGMQPF